ncbi:hypothetical protein AB8Q18_04410 [Neisseriaceae bacterium CLB008]
MKKILIFIIISCGAANLQAKGPTKVILLNHNETQAIYTALNDFHSTNKIDDLNLFSVTVHSADNNIRIQISEELESNDSVFKKGGGAPVFVYELSKHGNKIINTKKLLQR